MSNSSGLSDYALMLSKAAAAAPAAKTLLEENLWVNEYVTQRAAEARDVKVSMGLIDPPPLEPSPWRLADRTTPTPGVAMVTPFDPVFRPQHYARYVIEPITFIEANRIPYAVGNVIKYVLRYDAKDGLQDLKKARRYIDIIIETLSRNARVAAGEDANVVWKDTL